MTQDQIDLIESFFAENKTMYVATVTKDGDPNVRPFMWVGFFDKKLYICLGNFKNVYQEIINHPRIAISGMNPKGEAIRIFGDAKEVPAPEIKKAIFERSPVLLGPYPDGANDKKFSLLQISNIDVLLFNGEKFHLND